MKPDVTAYSILMNWRFINKDLPDEKLEQIKYFCENDYKMKRLTNRYIETGSNSTVVTIWRHLVKLMSLQNENSLSTKEGEKTCASCYNPRLLSEFSRDEKDAVCMTCLREATMKREVFIKKQMYGLQELAESKK